MTLMPLSYNTTEQVLTLHTNFIKNEDIQRNSEIPDRVVIWALIDGFLFLTIVSGNVLTIAAIIMNRRLSYIVSNQFILSLACSDLLVGLVIPYHMMFYIEPAMGKQFELCIARLALLSLACTASVMNIIGITIDRFLAIVYPLHYNKLMTKRVARCIAFIAWTFAISISITPIFWNNWEENWNKVPKGKCEFGYVVVPLYAKTVYLPTFFLLFTIMFAFYVKIFSETRKHTKRLRQNNITDSCKSVQVLMLVMGSFTISYTPFMIVIILSSIFQHHTNTTAYKVCNLLALANSAVNPIIYAWKSQDFKKAFSKILNCKYIDGGLSESPIGMRMSKTLKNTNAVAPDSKPTMDPAPRNSIPMLLSIKQ